MQEIPILIVLVILSAFFSGLEIALFSISEAKLRSLSLEEGRVGKQARRVLEIKSKPEKLLVTILIGNNLVNIGAASIATMLAIETFGSSGVGIATGIMTLIILIAGEIIPKSLAQRNADSIARWTSPVTSFLLTIFTPFSFILELLAKLANLIAGGDGTMEGVSEEEVKAMVYMGSESGTVEADEREMIEKIFTLNDVTAEDVMTHSTDMVSVNIAQGSREVMKIMVETGFSRFPVYSGNIDNIEGIIYTKDVMEALVDFGTGDINEVSIRNLIKPAIFVPEEKPLDDLLRSFQKETKHIAIVVNEFGETRGLVTLEDILEEIVGEIIDEQDEGSDVIKQVNKKTIIVDGDVDVSDIEDHLAVDLGESNHKSIAWVILKELGIVPEKGDELTINNVKIIIEEAEETKIKRVKLIKIR
ncbi:MAG: hemolysin family protein [bacterium]|nr:hemolysin family protein [bacterium]